MEMGTVLLHSHLRSQWYLGHIIDIMIINIIIGIIIIIIPTLGF